MKSYDDKIVKLLKYSTKLDKTNFKTIVNNKKFDVVLLIVDTDYDFYSEKIAKYFNRVTERFKTLGIKSVLFATYDINDNGPLTGERVYFNLFFRLWQIKVKFMCLDLIIKDLLNIRKVLLF